MNNDVACEIELPSEIWRIIVTQCADGLASFRKEAPAIDTTLANPIVQTFGSDRRDAWLMLHKPAKPEKKLLPYDNLDGMDVADTYDASYAPSEEEASASASSDYEYSDTDEPPNRMSSFDCTRECIVPMVRTLLRLGLVCKTIRRVIDWKKVWLQLTTLQKIGAIWNLPYGYLLECRGAYRVFNDGIVPTDRAYELMTVAYVYGFNEWERRKAMGKSLILPQSLIVRPLWLKLALRRERARSLAIFKDAYRINWIKRTRSATKLKWQDTDSDIRPTKRARKE